MASVKRTRKLMVEIKKGRRLLRNPISIKGKVRSILELCIVKKKLLSLNSKMDLLIKFL